MQLYRNKKFWTTIGFRGAFIIINWSKLLPSNFILAFWNSVEVAGTVLVYQRDALYGPGRVKINKINIYSCMTPASAALCAFYLNALWAASVKQMVIIIQIV